MSLRVGGLLVALLALVCLSSALSSSLGRKHHRHAKLRRSSQSNSVAPRVLSPAELGVLSKGLVTAIKDGKYGFAGSDALAASRAQVTDASFGKTLVMELGPGLSALRADVKLKMGAAEKCFHFGLPFPSEGDVTLVVDDVTVPTLYGECVTGSASDADEDVTADDPDPEANSKPESASSSSASQSEAELKNEAQTLQELLGKPEDIKAVENQLPKVYHYTMNKDPVFRKCSFVSRLQGACFSCWAFTASRVFAINTCIASKGKIKIRPSVQQLISCSKTYLHSSICDGGDIEVDAGAVWANHGVVSSAYLPYTAALARDIARPTPRTWCSAGAAANNKAFGRFGLISFYKRQFSELNLEKKSDAEKADIVKKVKEAIMTKGAVAGALAHHFTTIEGWTVRDKVENWIVSDTWTINPLYYATKAKAHKRKMKLIPFSKFRAYVTLASGEPQWKGMPYKIKEVKVVAPNKVKVTWDAPMHPGRMVDTLRIADVAKGDDRVLLDLPIKSRDVYVGSVEITPGKGTVTNGKLGLDFESSESIIDLKTPLKPGSKYEVRFCLRSSLQWVDTHEFTAP